MFLYMKYTALSCAEQKKKTHTQNQNIALTRKYLPMKRNT